MKKVIIIKLKSEPIKWKPIPRLIGRKSDSAFWKEVEVVLDKLENRRLIKRGSTEKSGIYLYSRKKGHVIFIPWDKINWSKLHINEYQFNRICHRVFPGTSKDIIFRASKPNQVLSRLPKMPDALKVTSTVLKSKVLKPYVVHVSPEGILTQARLHGLSGGFISILATKDYKYLEIPELTVLSKSRSITIWKKLADFIKELDYPQLKFIADGTEGHYMWARLGAQWMDPNVASRHKQRLIGALKTYYSCAKMQTPHDKLRFKLAVATINKARSPGKIYDKLCKIYDTRAAKNIFITAGPWWSILNTKSKYFRTVLKYLKLRYK